MSSEGSVGRGWSWTPLGTGPPPWHGNRKWVAGTGNDTRTNLRTNLVRQARRFDPGGEYMRRHPPEPVGVTTEPIHPPWRMGTRIRQEALRHGHRAEVHHAARPHRLRAGPVSRAIPTPPGRAPGRSARPPTSRPRRHSGHG
ncbi:FAD-binding domain-containing protein [Halostreptopolyspora alba]|uniref:Cryptochrome/DNA photolyase FAD-binding domain-containing protein n=1 Tax=Halostreptopolyspora alba TaxID=2487137 RepID=A0A3N0ED69_9ACTN|nr:hypothetical protein EFW17_07400 [Nocardiopsaceae bacterium YIM 96095]